jgi:hypothetical protein
LEGWSRTKIKSGSGTKIGDNTIIGLQLLDSSKLHQKKKPYTRRKPQLEWRYDQLICTIYVFMDACVKIDMISNLCACLFRQQLTKFPS